MIIAGGRLMFKIVNITSKQSCKRFSDSPHVGKVVNFTLLPSDQKDDGIGSEKPKPIKDMPCSPSEESIEWTQVQKTKNRYRKWDEEELVELGLAPDFPCCDCRKNELATDDNPVHENALWTLGEYRGWDEEDYIESGAGLPPWFPCRCDCGKYTDKKNKLANAETIEIDPKAIEGN